jgi:hypothetical protein
LGREVKLIIWLTSFLLLPGCSEIQRMTRAINSVTSEKDIRKAAKEYPKYSFSMYSIYTNTATSAVIHATSRIDPTKGMAALPIGEIQIDTTDKLVYKVIERKKSKLYSMQMLAFSSKPKLSVRETDSLKKFFRDTIASGGDIFRLLRESSNHRHTIGYSEPTLFAEDETNGEFAALLRKHKKGDVFTYDGVPDQHYHYHYIIRESTEEMLTTETVIAVVRPQMEMHPLR